MGLEGGEQNGKTVVCEVGLCLPSISEECMASFAAAASLALSKVTKPKPRERVGFSLKGGEV